MRKCSIPDIDFVVRDTASYPDNQYWQWIYIRVAL